MTIKGKIIIGENVLIGKNVNIDDLKIIKQSDVQTNNLTYMTPRKKHGFWIKDELLWIKDFQEEDVIVFRPMDGKEHKINKSDLDKFKLTGRP